MLKGNCQKKNITTCQRKISSYKSTFRNKNFQGTSSGHCFGCVVVSYLYANVTFICINVIWDDSINQGLIRHTVETSLVHELQKNGLFI